MSINPIPSPQPDAPPPSLPAPPALGLLPLNVPVLGSAAPEASPPGGARQLSRWEELEESWLPEERDLSRSGINE